MVEQEIHITNVQLTNFQQLSDAIIWTTVSEELVQYLTESMPQRINSALMPNKTWYLQDVTNEVADEFLY